MIVRILLVLVILAALADTVEGVQYFARNRSIKAARAADFRASLKAGKAEYAVQEVNIGPGEKTYVYHGGAVNSKNEIVSGWSSGNAIDHAATWINGMKQELPKPAGAESSMALGINDSGDIAGYVSTNTNQAILWKHNDYAHAVSLSSLPGYPCTEAWAINNKGQIAGRAYQTTAGKTPWWAVSMRAVLWDKNGVVHDLSVPPNCKESRAFGINDAGQVVGWALTQNNHTHAFLWYKGAMHDLGVLPGEDLSIASGINNQGQIIGDSVTSDGAVHPVMWWHGKMQDLGFPPHCRICRPKGINNKGEVFGDADGTSQFVWDAQHGCRLVNLPDDTNSYVQRAIAISDSGALVAGGVDRRYPEVYDHRLFVLTPRAQ